MVWLPNAGSSPWSAHTQGGGALWHMWSRWVTFIYTNGWATNTGQTLCLYGISDPVHTIYLSHLNFSHCPTVQSTIIPTGKNKVPSKGNTCDKRPTLRLQILRLATEIYILYVKAILVTANSRRISSDLGSMTWASSGSPLMLNRAWAHPSAVLLDFSTLSQDLIPLEFSKTNILISNTCASSELVPLKL